MGYCIESLAKIKKHKDGDPPLITPQTNVTDHPQQSRLRTVIRSEP